MVHSNIIELLRLCIYSIDKFDLITTESCLCKGHIDEKRGSRDPRVAAIFAMIWESDKYIGIKGWQVDIFCCTKKYIGNYDILLNGICVPTIRHYHNVFSIFPTSKNACFYCVTILNQYCKQIYYTKVSNLEINTIGIRYLNII